MDGDGRLEALSRVADAVQPVVDAVKLAHFKPQKGRPYAVVIKGERVLISSVPKDGRPAILVELDTVCEIGVELPPTS